MTSGWGKTLSCRHLTGICSWCQLRGKQRLPGCLCPALTEKQKEQERSDCSPGSENRRKLLIFFFFEEGHKLVEDKGQTAPPHHSVWEKLTECLRYPRAGLGSSHKNCHRPLGAPTLGMSDCVREVWSVFMKWSDRGSLCLESGILEAQVVEESQDWRTQQIQKEPGEEISDRVS